MFDSNTGKGKRHQTWLSTGTNMVVLSTNDTLPKYKFFFTSNKHCKAFESKLHSEKWFGKFIIQFPI